MIIALDWFIFKGNPFSLFSATMVGFIYFYCLTPLIFPEKVLFVINENNLVPILLILISSIICFAAGYHIFPKIRWRGFEKEINHPFIPSRTLWLAFIVVLGTLLILIAQSNSAGMNLIDYVSVSRYANADVNVFRTDPESSLRYLSMIGDYIILTVLPLIVASAYMNPKKIILLGLLVLTSLFFGWVIYKTGGRIRMLMYCLSGLLTYYFLVRPSTKKIILFSCATVICLLLLTQFQYLDRKKIGGTSDLEMNFGLDIYSDQNVALSMILEGIRSNRINYLYGESYALAAVQFIPRVIFPTKPGGEEMYAKLASVNYYGYWNVSYGIMGEMITNFGLWFFPIGMFLYGGILKNIWQLFLRNQNSPIAVMSYAIAYGAIFFTVRGSFASSFSTMFYSCLFLFAVTRLVVRRKHDLFY